MESVEMLAGMMGGKPRAGRPRLAAVLWKRETRRSRFPVAEWGKGGARREFSRGRLPNSGGRPWSGVGMGTGSPNTREERCGREDRAESDMVLRNIGGGKEGSGSVI